MDKLLGNITIIASALMLQSIVVDAKGWTMFSGVCLMIFAIVYGILVDMKSFLNVWR